MHRFLMSEVPLCILMREVPLCIIMSEVPLCSLMSEVTLCIFMSEVPLCILMSEVPLCRCESPYYVDAGRLKVKESHRFSSPLSFGTPLSLKSIEVPLLL